MKKKNKSNKPHKKETFPHFRWYRKSKHPALITGEHSENEYDYRKVTHDPKEGRHSNDKVEPNPNPKDDKPMYIVRRKRHDKKKYFGKRLAWKYPKK